MRYDDVSLFILGSVFSSLFVFIIISFGVVDSSTTVVSIDSACVFLQLLVVVLCLCVCASLICNWIFYFSQLFFYFLVLVFLVLDHAEEELAGAGNVNPFVVILLSLTSCACRSWFLGLQLLPLSCWLFFMSLTLRV